jgi:UPF0716 family protein affecting phage T7 exclusion
MPNPTPLPGPGRPASGLAAKAVAIVGGAALLVAGFVFSVVILAVVVVAGAALLGYAWWKTRALRKHLREQSTASSASPSTPPSGRVIEGEVIREDHEVHGASPDSRTVDPRVR